MLVVVLAVFVVVIVVVVVVVVALVRNDRDVVELSSAKSPFQKMNVDPLFGRKSNDVHLD